MAEERLSKNEKTRQQRDRFLAFAFSCADLFMEISKAGTITFALGASKSMTGTSDEELIGKNWLEIFSTYDHAQLAKIRENATPGKRAGPILVEMNENLKKRKAVFTALTMPGTTSFYVTLGVSNKTIGKLAARAPQDHGDLATVSAFIDEAQDACDFGRSIGEDPAMTLFDFGFTQTIEENEFDPDSWYAFQEELADFLQSHALNNANAGKITDSRYALVHDPDTDPEFLRSRIQEIAEKHLPLETGFKAQSETISADLSKIGDWEAEKALSYIVTGFKACDDIADMKIETLSAGIKKYATDDKDKISKLQSMIERVDFSLRFRPIVNLETNEVLYYEIIPHFKEGDTKSWLILAEDSGLAPALYLALCERAINHINFKAGGSRTKFSLSIPAESMEQGTFAEKLGEHLERAPNLHQRLHFEIARPSRIKNMTKAAVLLGQLVERGFDLTLDQCDITPNAIETVQTLNATAIKTTGKYLRKLDRDTRTASALSAMITACQKHHIRLETRGIETQAQARTLIKMGIDCGQGPLFGPPQDTPHFQPPSS